MKVVHRRLRKQDVAWLWVKRVAPYLKEFPEVHLFFVGMQIYEIFLFL